MSTPRSFRGTFVILLSLALTVVDVTAQGATGDNSPCAECVENAICVNNDCVCKAGFEGDPKFFCADSEEAISSSGSKDPVQATFSGENIVYHLMGSTRLVQLSTDRLLGGKCDFWLWGWTERNMGKFFFGGLAFRIDQRDGDVISTHRGYIQALGLAGEPYKWIVKLYGAEGNPDEVFEITMGMSEVKDWGGCIARFEEGRGFFLKVNFECCDIRFAIRPYHHDHDSRVSGYYTVIKKRANPTYNTWTYGSEPLTLDHTRNVTVKEVVANTGIADRREAMTFHAITNTALIEYPHAPQNLGLLKSMMMDCPEDRRDMLFSKIQCLLDNPKLIKCMNGASSSSIENSIQALLYSISYFCYDVIDSCVPLAYLLQRPECKNILDEFPIIRDLSEPDNCPTGVLQSDYRLDGKHYLYA